MDIRLSDDLRHRYERVRVGVHFIEDKGENLSDRQPKGVNAYLIYHCERRDKNLKELSDLAQFINENRSQHIKLLAIDTANRELCCPPEIFSELYERAVACGRRQGRSV